MYLLSFTLNAQEHFAKLERNKNIQAKGLIHKLNQTRDTLILQSDKKINYLYSINNEYGREIDVNVNATSFKFPLNNLSKGKHVFVAVQSPMRIVFVIRVLKDHPGEKPVLIKPVVTRPIKIATNTTINN
ncbi:MAG: hypothetical protein HKN40_13850 [Winogradskyella sp.]|nr:hypothetical protein [Winogradskyella sp.]